MLICYDQRSGTGCYAENPDGTAQCAHCQRNLRFALHLHNPGTRIRDYRIIRKIGFGGFGAVYEAEDTRQPNSRVAIKESFDPSGVTSFQGEFNALQGHHNPHLPRYDAMFEDQGSGYLVMEFIPGQSLEDVSAAERGPLLETEVLGFAIQLCNVLGYLHSQNPPILHRDIKPANIRITPGGRIKLVDFGLFKQGNNATASSRMGLTPAYAPLEQHPLAPGHTDQRSDIYSLGATLYHLLTGQPPVSAFDRIQTAPDPLLPPRHLNPQISPYVAAAITKAISIKPDDRFPTIAAFQDALVGQQLGAAVPRPAQPAPVPRPNPPAPKPVAARSAASVVGLGVGIGLAILIIVGIGLALANWPDDTVAIAPTAAPPTTVPPTTALPAWLPAMVEVPAGSFLMGSSDRDTQADSDEKPQQTVELPTYSIGTTEVTNAQFRPFVAGDGYSNRAYWTDNGWAWRQQMKRTQPYYWNDANWNGDNYPVAGVTWYEAVAYCNWLSAQTGQDFRLPTEVEWEKAARGTDGWIYPWGNTFDGTRLNYCDIVFQIMFLEGLVLQRERSF